MRRATSAFPCPYFRHHYSYNVYELRFSPLLPAGLASPKLFVAGAPLPTTPRAKTQHRPAIRQLNVSAPPQAPVLRLGGPEIQSPSRVTPPRADPISLRGLSWSAVSHRQRGNQVVGALRLSRQSDGPSALGCGHFRLMTSMSGME